MFSFSVSVSLTRQYRRNIRLMQELAIMEARLRELERRANAPVVMPEQRPELLQRWQSIRIEEKQ
jgi:flagellar biosynthesis/type III secretory pathway chaperone